MKKRPAVLAFTVVATLVTPHMAHSVTDIVPPVPAPAPPAPRGVAVGPWIVGGVMLSAFSLIVCSKVVGDRSHREMTSVEASRAALLPFICVADSVKSPAARNTRRCCIIYQPGHSGD